MKKRKILITGASGVLGKYVMESLHSDLLLSPTSKEFDISNQDQVRRFFYKHKPDIVIHLAAKTNVDDCEKDGKIAYLVNSNGTKYIAQSCGQIGSFLVYISTASIFDGEQPQFYEDDTPGPLSIYGKSKLRGEVFVRQFVKDFLILRAGWLIGGGAKEKKFISYILNQLKTQKKLYVVNDKKGSLTYAKEMSSTMEKLLKLKKKGIYHCASKGVCTRYDIAKKLIFLTNAKAEIIPVSSDYFKKKFFAPRLRNEVIVSRKLHNQNTWENSLENYYRNELINVA